MSSASESDSAESAESDEYDEADESDEKNETLKVENEIKKNVKNIPKKGKQVWLADHEGSFFDIILKKKPKK